MTITLSLQAGDAKFTGKRPAADAGAHGTERDDLLKSLDLMQSNLLKDKKRSRKMAPPVYPVHQYSSEEADNYYSGVASYYVSMKRWPISPSGSVENASLAPLSAIMAPTATASMEIMIGSPREDEPHWRLLRIRVAALSLPSAAGKSAKVTTG